MPKPAQDLTSLRFGKLTVIARSRNKGKVIYWKCRCDCGTFKEIAGDSLKRGLSSSCGCAVEEKRDFKGRRNGMLVAICPTNEFTGTNRKWKFKCDCGNEISIVPYSVFKKKYPTVSCGCMSLALRQEALREKAFSKKCYIGVRKIGNKFAAKSSEKHLGMFETDIEAANAYDKSVKERDGINAVVNFPDMSEFEE